MRNFKTILGLLCFCGVFGLMAPGCTTDEEETREFEFSLSRYSVAFPVEGGMTVLTVATESEWTASTDASWLSIAQDGSTLCITAEANDRTDEIRQAEVYVAAASSATDGSLNSATVQVRQEPAEEVSISLKYGTDDLAIDSEGGTFTIVVDCNYAWSAALVSPVDGWELNADNAANRIVVTAAANAGEALSGTVRVTAGNEWLSSYKDVEVRQMSRSENGYFHFVGDWTVTASDYCTNDGILKGEAGTTSCQITDYSYATETFGMYNWAGLSGLHTEKFVYDPEAGTATLTLGYLAGSVIESDGASYYMYIVVFNTDFTEFSAPDIVFTISPDGESMTVSGIPEDYPILGWVMYNAYYGYCLTSRAPYLAGSISLAKNNGSTPSTASLSLNPVDELPDGVPAVLPKGFVGRISSERL